MNSKKEIKFEQPSEILLIINRYVIVIMGLIILSLLVLGYFFLLKPRIDVIQEKEQEDIEVEERRLSNERLLTKVRQLEEEYLAIKADQEGQLERLIKMVPDNPHIAELFVMANQLAEDRGFHLLSIDISESTDDFDRPAQEEEPAQPPPTEEFVEDARLMPANQDSLLNTNVASEVLGLNRLLIHMTVAYQVADEEEEEERGEEEEEAQVPYELFKEFLAALENNLRLMDIQTVTFGELPNPPTDSVTFDFTIITYYQ